MPLLKCVGLVLAAVLLALRATGCAASSGQDSGSDNLFGTAAGGSTATDASMSTGAAPSGSGGDFGFGDAFGHAVPVTVNGKDGSCNAISQAPESITVYRDATVTDTVTTDKPVAIYIMQDRSLSMNDGNPSKWSAAVNGITAFVNDPKSAGLDVGLAVFEPVGGGGMCDGSDCGQPVVPIGPLPRNASPIVTGIQGIRPGGLTPTECAIKGAIDHCLVHTSQTGEQCAVVLITDGQPTSCNTDPNYLAGLVSAANKEGVLTFALGMNGADFNFLNQIAQAGGTKQSYDVTAQAAFVTALNNIRQTVSITTTHQVVSHQVIETHLACQWKIPPPPDGKEFDKTQVNVALTAPDGHTTQYGNVASLGDCSRAGDGWYYDNPTSPTEILVCPKTCDTLKNSTDSRIDILFGCATIPVTFH